MTANIWSTAVGEPSRITIISSTLESMRLLTILFLLSLLLITSCGRSSLQGGASAPAPAADSSVSSPTVCSSLSLLGTAELGTMGRDSLAPAIAGRGGLLGVSWTELRNPGTNDLELRLATFGAGLKPAPSAGVVVSDALPGPPVGLAAGPQAWAALFMRGSHTGSLVPKLVLARFDGAGKPQGPTLEITAQAMAQALAARALGGYGMIYTHPSKVGAINFRALDGTGKAGAARLVVSGDYYNDLWLAEMPGGGYLAGWWGKQHMLARLELDGRLPAPPAVVAPRSGNWAARYVLAGADRVGVLYLRRPAPQVAPELMFKLVRGDGSEVAPARKIAGRVGILGSPALAWSGKRYVVVYDDERADLKLSARLLDSDGAPVGAAVALPSCMLTARAPVTAWAGDTVGVAFQGGLSGLPTQRACLVALRCE